MDAKGPLIAGGIVAVGAVAALAIMQGKSGAPTPEAEPVAIDDRGAPQHVPAPAAETGGSAPAPVAGLPDALQPAGPPPAVQAPPAPAQPQASQAPANVAGIWAGPGVMLGFLQDGSRLMVAAGDGLQAIEGAGEVLGQNIRFRFTVSDGVQTGTFECSGQVASGDRQMTATCRANGMAGAPVTYVRIQ